MITDINSEDRLVQQTFAGHLEKVLGWSSVSKADRERLKQASKGLLASLRDLLRPMHDWTQNTTTQSDVRVFILDNLWRALPRPPFTDAQAEAVADRVYDFVWQQSASGHDLTAA